jgi:hypothetical protein
MLNAHLWKLSRKSIVIAAAALTLPVTRLQAQQPASLVDGPAGYQVACSIQDSTGFRTCGETLPRSCDAENSYASQPSRESTGIVLVNRSGQPVKVYWLNFQGRRVLYQTLPPGGQQTQQTFVGHNWLVATMTEQCIGIFATAPAPILDAGSATIAPPEFPEYEQPPPPEENLIWTPGYWGWNQDISDYYWVPGTWVAAPIVGYLWTPGYWWVVRRGVYAWRVGYWGPHVGFYGGINYGHGYFGRGYVGGSWRDGRMLYNSAVTHMGKFQSSNAYNQPVANNASAGPRVSYAGGGAQPNAAELAAAAEYHIPPTAAQLQHFHAAHDNPAMRASSNNGQPPLGATPRPGEISSDPLPRAQHAGTLSITHSTFPQPSRSARTDVPHKAAPAAPTPAAAHPQNQPSTPQPQAHVAQAPAEQQSAPQETKQAHKNSPPPPRTVPRTEGHPS